MTPEYKMQLFNELVSNQSFLMSAEKRVLKRALRLQQFKSLIFTAAGDVDQKGLKYQNSSEPSSPVSSASFLIPENSWDNYLVNSRPPARHPQVQSTLSTAMSDP